MKVKSSYEAVSDAYMELSEEYFRLVCALPKNCGQVALNTIWALQRYAVLSLFEAHGWTEEEWEAILDARLAESGI